jgi:hypothetical protein
VYGRVHTSVTKGSAKVTRFGASHSELSSEDKEDVDRVNTLSSSSDVERRRAFTQNESDDNGSQKSTITYSASDPIGSHDGGWHGCRCKTRRRASCSTLIVMVKDCGGRVAVA